MLIGAIGGAKTRGKKRSSTCNFFAILRQVSPSPYLRSEDALLRRSRKSGMIFFLDLFDEVGQKGVVDEHKIPTLQPDLLLSKDLATTWAALLNETPRQNTAVQPSLTSSLSLCAPTVRLIRSAKSTQAVGSIEPISRWREGYCSPRDGAPVRKSAVSSQEATIRSASSPFTVRRSLACQGQYQFRIISSPLIETVF